ncbi:MAG: hypothetical protein RLZZ380_967 [Actinomycetota bacterium]
MTSLDPKDAAAKRLGIDNSGESPTQSGKSILATLGGPIGVLESLIPGTIYVTLFGLTLDVVLSAVAAASVALVFAVIQLIRKRPLTQVFAGLVGLAISIYLPLRDGLSDTHAADYFVPGLITNFAYLIVLSISVLVRFPLLGVILSILAGKGQVWRKDKALFRRYNWITIMWIGMFGTRLAVQLPLYLANQVPVLGIAKLALGTPLYALVIWFTWLSAKETFKPPK